MALEESHRTEIRNLYLQVIWLCLKLECTLKNGYLDWEKDYQQVDELGYPIFKQIHRTIMEWSNLHSFEVSYTPDFADSCPVSS